jgi:hypothetical protein
MKNICLGCSKAQDWIKTARFLCKHQLLCLCFLSKYVMSFSWMISSLIIISPLLIHSHHMALCLL